MSSNNPVDTAAVVSDAPLGEPPQNDDEAAPHEVRQAEGSDEPADDPGS